MCNVLIFCCELLLDENISSEVLLVQLYVIGKVNGVGAPDRNALLEELRTTRNTLRWLL